MYFSPLHRHIQNNITDKRKILNYRMRISRFWTHCCSPEAEGCVWSPHTSPQERCPWSHNGTSNRTRLSSHRTSQTPLHLWPHRWLQDRWGKGSSCPLLLASCLVWNCSEWASEVPDQKVHTHTLWYIEFSKHKCQLCIYEEIRSYM